jgi:hypothetical protein
MIDLRVRWMSRVRPSVEGYDEGSLAVTEFLYPGVPGMQLKAVGHPTNRE